MKHGFLPKAFTHLTGVPTSIDPGYAKEDAAKAFKSQLKKWVGKQQDVELQFLQWQESNILAVFDLKLWFALEGIEYTNISLHRLIWPNNRVSSKTGYHVNPHDDIDHISHLVDKAINLQVVRELVLLTEARLYQKESKKK